ncbi:MAG: response regulator, partial [Gammaproteobacteria bacterium]|nr:response regulator [Gammaproteobacteria bacterium]
MNESQLLQDEFHRERDAHYERLINTSRIMMVDDEPINMEVLQLHLESEGYNNFISTSDSSEAVELTRKAQPDVLLLDLMMPKVSGFDILQALRQDPDLWQTPVIVLTSSDDPETKLQALRLGANDFLSKPVDASELALRLRNTLAAQAFQHQLEHFDSLTGLPNRKLFDKNVRILMKSAAADELQHGLLLVNLDRFKTINDSMGRKIGDEVLHAVARRLQIRFGGEGQSAGGDRDATARKVYRFGGDKFAVLLPALTEAQDAIVLAKPFLKHMEEPFDVVGEQ